MSLVRIFKAKLNILENELSEKIARFAQQPHIDGDGFLEFSDEFINEWKQIEQMIRQLTSNDDKDTLREGLDELANRALKETIPLKKIITKKLDELCPGDQKEAQIDAMKVIINDIGMFDGAAYRLLVRFEHEEFANTDFCAELEKAVAEDKEMISKAYQVKDPEE